MPELAEVEYYRRQWLGGLRERVLAVRLHPDKRDFRGLDTEALAKALTGARLLTAEARGKQMLFGFTRHTWLGIHLGMTGTLSVAEPGYSPARHDHLVLVQQRRALVFRDPRCFGRVLFDQGREKPEWWRRMVAPPHDRTFSFAKLRHILHRHRRAPLKAVLLRQDRFAGIGNWMADEILWRARLAPQLRAEQLSRRQQERLWEKTRWVCRQALRVVAKEKADPPASWLFRHRWKHGGRCPRDGTALARGVVGGRTTAWCPQCQKA